MLLLDQQATDDFLLENSGRSIERLNCYGNEIIVVLFGGNRIHAESA